MFVLAALTLVRALSLPFGFTVNPERNVPAIVFGNDGTVAAVAQSTDRTGRFRALRWNASGRYQVFGALTVSTAPGAQDSTVGNNDPDSRAYATAVANAGRDLFVTAATSWSGAYSGESFEIQRWGRYSAARWPLPPCVKSSDSVDQHAYGGDADGRLAVTIDRTGAGSFQVLGDDPEQYAPYAYVVRGGSCRNLGRAVVQAVRGQWAAGYRGYLDGKIAPDNLNNERQKIVAVRWYGARVRELGPGDALAINGDGFTVGADAVPARTGCTTMGFSNAGHTESHTYCPGIPHAVAWDTTGRRIALAPNSPRSVAYAVSKDGTVVGMLIDSKGWHFAFRWRHGTLQRLDDLPHPRGWRFEAAYAIGTDGAIAGIGTLNGIPKVFVWNLTTRAAS